MADEPAKKGNGETEPTVVFHYIKNQNFRVIHLDGVIGNITPQGHLHMAMWSERQAIPQRMTYPVKPDGNLGEPILSEIITRGGYVREIDFSVMLNIDVAKSLHQWLGQKLDEFAVIQRKRGKGEQ